MDRRAFLGTAASALAVQSLGLGRLQADDLPPEIQKCVDRGLAYLVKTQFRDGHFEGANGQYPVALTSLAGMAFLMEGSTIREGKYSDNVRRIVDYLMDRTQRSGLIGNPNNLQESQRYTYGHGFGMLFLSCVYGEEDDGDRRSKLEDVLTRGAEFCAKAQTTKGGWGYVSAADMNDFDEGSVTITQLQAMRAARNTGIVVPKQSIDKAKKYLEDCTGPDGHLMYRPGQPGARPALTAAAICCGFSMGEYDSGIVKKWIKAAHKGVGALGGGAGVRFGHDEYAHYYMAQTVYILGDDGYAKLFPGTPANECLTWSGYKKQNFDNVIKGQNEDGSWTGNSPWARFGAVYTTSMYLSILQLDKAVLPIYQR
jgi:hypothetical protein